MNILFDPNVAYLLLVVGLLLAILALFSPGTGILEAGALIILIIAGFSISNMQINLWALGILVIGVFPFLLALRKSGQWIFFIIALVALILGSVFLISGENGLPTINPVLATIASLTSSGLLWVVGRKGMEAMKLKPHQSLDDLPGEIGEARTDVAPEGSVYVGGENWSARSKKPIRNGARIRVISRDGLVLQVEEVPQES